MANHTLPAAPVRTEWASQIPDSEWRSYRVAIDAVGRAGVPFLLGGAFGLACHTGRWRNTKDLDLYILPDDRDAAAAALTRAGFTDYHEVMPYDRRWIHRTTRDGIIVDLIWAMANQRAQVDRLWFERAAAIEIHGVALGAIPAEELVWAKLYVMQRDRCDWTDVFNLLDAVGPRLDWEHLLRRLDDDVPLLTGALAVFAWLAPDRMREMARFDDLPMVALSAGGEDTVRRRTALLDTRPWFVRTAQPRPTDP